MTFFTGTCSLKIMEIVVGTYEELILGYKYVENEKGCFLEQSFTDHSHTGGVKTLAVSKKGILASGSSDETIRLINLKQRKELGSLLQHEGSVTSLQFYSSGSHMFSSSEDGTVCIWKTGGWECSRILRGHKSPVYSVSVHPSGKLGLSLGKDKTLRTWNLMTAKTAYVTNIKQVADIVLWSPDGSLYVIVCNNKADVYSVETAGICHTIQSDFRISSSIFITEDILSLGGEEGKVEFHSLKRKVRLHTLETNTNRVKGLCCWKSTESEGRYSLVTASSDSFLKVWQIELDRDAITTQLSAEVNTKFRLTCVACWQRDEQQSNVNTASGSKVGKGSEDVKTESSQTRKGKRQNLITEDDEEETGVTRKKTKVQFTDSNSEDSKGSKKKRKKKTNRS